MIEHKNKEYSINIRNLFNTLFYIGYFISLMLYTNSSNQLFIYLSIISCLMLAWFNPKQVNFAISSYLGFFVISIMANVNYLAYFSVINLLYIMLVHYNRILVPFKSKLFYVFLLVTTIVGISTINSINQILAKEAFFAFVVAVLILYSLQVLNSKDFLMKDLYWNSCLYVVGMVLVFFSGHSIQELNNTHRALIYFIGDNGIRSNTLAGFSAMFLFVCIGSFISNKSIIKKLISTVTFFLLIIILFYIISRGALLGIVVSILPLILYKLRKKTLGYILITSIMILLSFLFIPDILESRIFNVSNNDYSNGRFYFYELAYNQFKLHPLIGNGMYQFGFLSGFNTLEDPHNWLLAYLSGIGIIGTVVFFVFLFQTINKIIEVYRFKLTNKDAIPFAQATLVPIIHGLVEPTLSTSMPLMLFCIFVPILVSMKINKEVNLL